MIPAATPHAPLGALASFNLGPAGAPAGFALPPGAAPAQNVVIGCRPNSAEKWSLLPFFTPPPAGPLPLPRGRFGRFLGWAGDKWMIGPLVFKLATPFAPSFSTDGEKFRYAPVVCGYLEYDNTHSADAAELVFGLDGHPRPVADAGFTGFACGATHGFATPVSAEVEPRRGASVFGTDFDGLAALHFTVPPHAKRIYPLAVGFCQPGFHYAQWFGDLGAVLAHGLTAHARYLAIADARDAEFMRSALPFDAKQTAAQAVRAWLANTRRLAGEPEVGLADLQALCRAVTG
jgi:hypothetical protein